VNFEFILAAHHVHSSGNPFQAYPWYVAVPLVVVAVGYRIWRWRRGGSRGNPFDDRQD
jgi:hypothetical protein